MDFFYGNIDKDNLRVSIIDTGDCLEIFCPDFLNKKYVLLWLKSCSEIVEEHDQSYIIKKKDNIKSLLYKNYYLYLE